MNWPRTIVIMQRGIRQATGTKRSTCGLDRSIGVPRWAASSPRTLLTRLSSGRPGAPPSRRKATSSIRSDKTDVSISLSPPLRPTGVQLKPLNHTPIARTMSSAVSKSSPQSSDLRTSLAPSLLADLRSFWFSHLHDEESMILPGMDKWQRWFQSDQEFDKLCV